MAETRYPTEPSPCPLAEDVKPIHDDCVVTLQVQSRSTVIDRFPDPPVDHIELFAPPRDSANDSRNFVLCPGKAYDRSACGTGTSAKLACLFAERKFGPGEVWRQESITGSVFEGAIETTADDGVVIPCITGTAYITAEATLIADDDDPLRDGIR